MRATQEWLYLASRSRQGASADAEVLLKKGQGISPDACFESTRMLRLGRGAKRTSPSHNGEGPSASDGGGSLPDTSANAGSGDDAIVSGGNSNGDGDLTELPDVYPGDKVCVCIRSPMKLPHFFLARNAAGMCIWSSSHQMPLQRRRAIESPHAPVSNLGRAARGASVAAQRASRACIRFVEMLRPVLGLKSE